LARWVREHFGISYSARALDILDGRLRLLAVELGLSIEDLHARVEGGAPDLTRRLAEVVSTNHTYFLRERGIFDELTRRVVPSLPSGSLRIWSAAASSGDEAYSVALTLQEALGDDARRVRILGTDISAQQVAAAEAGVFPGARLYKLAPAQLVRWFRELPGGRYEVSPTLRKMCAFRQLNLVRHPWPFTQRFHVIFLRNVLYYFEPEMRRQVLDACYQTAEPGGWLVTSLTEPLHDIWTRWRLVAPGLYRKEP